MVKIDHGEITVSGEATLILNELAAGIAQVAKIFGEKFEVEEEIVIKELLEKVVSIQNLQNLNNRFPEEGVDNFITKASEKYYDNEDAFCVIERNRSKKTRLMDSHLNEDFFLDPRFIEEGEI
jgi:hypothetical protein